MDIAHLAEQHPAPHVVAALAVTGRRPTHHTRHRHPIFHRVVAAVAVAEAVQVEAEPAET